MSNITSLQIGNNVLNAEPNRKINCQIMLDESHNNVGEYQIDLSNILPNDDYIYELYVTESTSGLKNCSVLYKTDIETPYVTFSSVNPDSMLNRNSFVIEVGKARKLYQKITDNTSGYRNLFLSGYRKLYKDNSNG